jgi:DNA invertase Pin-like site-specific DNA recombinase
MPLYGYARISTLDQDLAIQHAALKVAGYEVIHSEKARRDRRSKLQALFDSLRAGVTLVVTRIDSLACSLKDLQDIVYDLKARTAAVSLMRCPQSCPACWQRSTVRPAELSGIRTFYNMAFEQAK